MPLEELNCLFEGWISCCHIPGGLLNTVPWTVTRGDVLEKVERVVTLEKVERVAPLKANPTSSDPVLRPHPDLGEGEVTIRDERSWGWTITREAEMRGAPWRSRRRGGEGGGERSWGLN